MPYIPLKNRAMFDRIFDILADLDPLTVGELNYLLTGIIDQWLLGTVNYTSLNAMMGVLECVKQELYRRIVAPYEDDKRAANGDVYQCRGAQ